MAVRAYTKLGIKTWYWQLKYITSVKFAVYTPGYSFIETSDELKNLMQINSFDRYVLNIYQGKRLPLYSGQTISDKNVAT